MAYGGVRVEPTVRLRRGVEGVENTHASLHFFAGPKTDLCQYMIGDLNQLSFCGVQNCWSWAIGIL